jgi:glycosyltransferase involved in cell wall biosynthesis
MSRFCDYNRSVTRTRYLAITRKPSVLSTLVNKKSWRRRMSICYAAPGHALLSTSGSARNILSLADSLSQWTDVTVAFRSLREPFHSDKFKVIAIEPEIEGAAGRNDDVAANGLNVFAHASYLRKLSQFCRESAPSYDLIFEKGWRLSGFLSSVFCRHGVPGVLVENDMRHWSESVGNVRSLARYGAHSAAQGLSRFYSRRIPLVIAETDELKAMLVASRGVKPEKVEVVGLGVDHELFRPLDQASCRNALGIEPKACVLLYVGGMDTYHDLGPVIDATSKISVPSLELHLVGDGEYRGIYEARAKHALSVPVRFHGQVPHFRIPEFIAAADLCLAPYRVSAFPNESVSFSTLKIPEYMACRRPVASVPSGHIKKLIEDQLSGFLFPNDVPSWVSFLKTLPSRDRLKQMGDAALRAVESISWAQTAQRYLEACQELITRESITEGPYRQQI